MTRIHGIDRTQVCDSNFNLINPLTIEEATRVDSNTASIPLWDTGSVAQSILIADTSKPATPQLTLTHNFPAKDSANVTLYGSSAVIQILKFAGMVTLDFSNSDTVDHTAYYELDVNGTTFTGSIDVPAGGTATATVDIYVLNPTSNSVTMGVYLWADTADVVTLIAYSVLMGVGTNSTTEDDLVRINRTGYQTLAAHYFAGAGVTQYKARLKTADVYVKLSEVVNDDMFASVLLPPTILSALITIGSGYVFITGVQSLKKEV